jgi:DNA topoisomerase VI subunit B
VNATDAVATRAVPTRDLHRIDRALEFFTEDELAKRVGHARPWWAASAAVELVGNALDAAETVPGLTPEVTVTVDGDTLAVADNGPGIPPEVVRDSLDYRIRVTDKAFYVSPTRGRQGNALKTVWAMPFVVGGDRGTGHVEVEARATRHVVSVTMDELSGRPDIDHREHPSGVKTGTVVRVTWPGLACSLTPARGADFYGGYTTDAPLLAGSMRSVEVLVRAFALFNPHADFRLRQDGHEALFRARRPGWSKWMTSRPSPPHWYTPRQLADLAAALARADRAAGRRVRSVREFVATFKGLSGTPKQKAVYEAAGLTAQTLADLFPGNRPDTDQVGRLHRAMCEAGDNPDPKALGVIGKEQFLAGMRDLFGGDGAEKYVAASGHEGGVPWVLEVGFAVNRDDAARRMVASGVNWSAALRLPFEGLADALQDGRADLYDPVVIAVHLAYPAAGATDPGKSRYDLPPAIRAALGELIDRVTREWQKEKARAERAAAQDRRLTHDALEDLRRGEVRKEKQLIRDAAYAVMADAYAEAAGSQGVAHARQVMYAARPKVLARTGGKCWKNSEYFTQTLLPDYLAEHAAETATWDVVFDDRGHFHEPHTGESIGIGTLAVRGYVRGWGSPVCDEAPVAARIDPEYPTGGPGNRFRYVLFLEKEGFHPLIERAGIARRYDLAVMSTKGMTVTAARRLIEELSAEGVTVLVLHDFDKSGLGILHTMRTSNRRYEFRRKPRVIDLGLRLADVERLNLPSEPVQYPTKKDPRIRLREYGATRAEADFLVRRQPSPKLWEGERVELNAIMADRFVEFLEAKLDRHGVTKVVPGAGVLAAAYRRAHRIARVNDAIERAAGAANARAVTPPADLAARVAEHLARDPAAPWDEAVYEIARRDAGTTGPDRG